jgi:SSS family solute:Na+ symporter
VVGGTYFLGPDIISRNLVSKDGKTAKKAAGLAGLVLIVFAVIIVLIGMWVKYNVDSEVLAGQNPLVYLINNVIPRPIGIILAIGLISALLSSADTCLINAASIVEKDILKRDKVTEIRGWVLVLGVVAIVIAVGKSDIISILTGAYSVYAPGVVFPLLIAILCHGRRKIRPAIWVLAVLCGGVCGAITTYTPYGFYELPLIGMGISLVVALLSVNWRRTGE